MFEMEDYDIIFFINILLIFRGEYNRVLVPTLGKNNKIYESYPHRTQTSQQLTPLPTPASNLSPAASTMSTVHQNFKLQLQ